MFLHSQHFTVSSPVLRQQFPTTYQLSSSLRPQFSADCSITATFQRWVTQDWMSLRRSWSLSLHKLNWSELTPEVEVTLWPTVSRPLGLGVLPLLERVTRCYIHLSDNYFLYFSCRKPSLTRGRVCNLQWNDASSISRRSVGQFVLVQGPQWGP
jgi:hypothetical protein